VEDTRSDGPSTETRRDVVRFLGRFAAFSGLMLGVRLGWDALLGRALDIEERSEFAIIWGLLMAAIWPIMRAWSARSRTKIDA